MFKQIALFLFDDYFTSGYYVYFILFVYEFMLLKYIIIIKEDLQPTNQRMAAI